MQKVDKKIRVISSNLYTIEVNEEGETISLDLTDMNLINNLNKTFRELDSISKNFIKDIKEIEEMDATEMEDSYTTKKEAKQMSLINNFYADSRRTLDGFLGEGACQKIFGDHNFMSMFDDLAKALQPCFEDMKKKIVKQQSEMRKQYAKQTKKQQVKL